MVVQSAAAAGWSQSLSMLPSSLIPQCKPGSTSSRCSGRDCRCAGPWLSRIGIIDPWIKQCQTWSETFGSLESFNKVSLREGCTNENPEKVWSFARPPSDPPGLAFSFRITKSFTHFKVLKRFRKAFSAPVFCSGLVVHSFADQGTRLFHIFNAFCW